MKITAYGALFLAGCLVTGSLLTPSSSFAQSASNGGGLDEIVVTARRKDENLQSVPVTVAVVSQDELRDEGIRAAADLPTAVPGLQVQTVNGPRDQVTFALRGNYVTANTSGLAVAPYFAEVPLQQLGTGEFYDLQNVQVLKGPQGTLFGQVTTGGAVLLSPVKPGDKFEGYVSGELGNYDFRQFEGAVTLPIIPDIVSLRIAGDFTRRNGYTLNTFNGIRLDNLDNQGGRIGLLVKPFEGLENYTIVSFNSSHNNGTAGVITAVNPLDGVPGFACCDAAGLEAALAQQQALGPRAVYIGETNLPSLSVQRGNGVFFDRNELWVANTTTWSYSDALILKNIFGYQTFYQQDGYAVGYSGLGFNVDPFNPIVDTRQYSNELQAQGKLFNGKLNYTTGFFYKDSAHIEPNESFAVAYDGFLVGLAPANTSSNSKAGYAQIAYNVFDPLTLDLGIRRTRDYVSETSALVAGIGQDLAAFPSGTCPTPSSPLPPALILSEPCHRDSASFGITTWTVGADYQVTNDTFAYVSLRKGYRPGGFNTAFVPGEPTPPYAPETNISREIGLKTTYHVADATLRTNLALFYDTLEGSQQVKQEAAAGAAELGQTIVTNAAQVTIKGIELDQTAVFFERLTLNVNWAYIDGSFDADKFHYTPAQLAAACPANALITVPDPTLICPNNPIPYTARNVATFRADYKLPLPEKIGSVVLGGNVYYTGKIPQAGDAPDLAYSPSYALLNGNLTWQNVMGTAFEGGLFVNNLANRLYNTTNGYNSLVLGSYGALPRYYGPPRMYGVSLKYSF